MHACISIYSNVYVCIQVCTGIYLPKPDFPELEHCYTNQVSSHCLALHYHSCLVTSDDLETNVVVYVFLCICRNLLEFTLSIQPWYRFDHV